MADNNIPRRIYPSPAPILRPTTPSQPKPELGTPSFQDLLQQQLSDQQLRFSKHATQRLESRNIALSQHDIARLNQAVEQAAQKGGRDSLILMNRTAFLVNVPNRTVVTAVDGESMKGNVFTNIDSAVIVE